MPIRTEVNLADTNRFIHFPKSAFTLAEVLITLGIIGVVAAMTIPNLITEHQKRATVTKLQRAISVINQAYRLAYDDVGEVSAEEAFNMGSEEYFNTYWAPYIKVLTYCSSYKVCGYDSNYPFKNANGKSSSLTLVHEMGTTFFTMDGFLYIVRTGYGNDNTGENEQCGFVVVDINGSSNPNRFGHDVFLLERVEEEGYEKGATVRPYGYDLTDKEIKSKCSADAPSYHWTEDVCAELIRRAGWKIEKDYPW